MVGQPDWVQSGVFAGRRRSAPDQSDTRRLNPKERVISVPEVRLEP
jgi:hypothetical protein